MVFHFMKGRDLQRLEPLIYGRLQDLETSRWLTDLRWNKMPLKMASSHSLKVIQAGEGGCRDAINVEWVDRLVA